MKCFNCQKEFEAKRESAKYCSANCRVKAYQKREVKTKKESVMTMQVVMNTILEIAGKINYSVPPTLDASKISSIKFDELGQWQEAKKSEKTFQQFMNEIPDLQFEAEFIKLAGEIEVSVLSRKQKDLLLSNMRQSKF